MSYDNDKTYQGSIDGYAAVSSSYYSKDSASNFCRAKNRWMILGIFCGIIIALCIIMAVIFTTTDLNTDKDNDIGGGDEGNRGKLGVESLIGLECKSVWTDWGEWTHCDEKIMMKRKRSCKCDNNHNAPCENPNLGSNMQMRPCVKREWTVWSQCEYKAGCKLTDRQGGYQIGDEDSCCTKKRRCRSNSCPGNDEESCKYGSDCSYQWNAWTTCIRDWSCAGPEGSNLAYGAPNKCCTRTRTCRGALCSGKPDELCKYGWKQPLGCDP